MSVQKIWNITPGEDEGEWWAGAEPAGLFRSVDGGDTWSSIDALNLRPDRAKWMPGGGGLCLHTVLPYPNEPDRMLLAASAVGVFGSHDRGQSWRLMNGDVRADYSPEKITTESQIGSCPHALARDAANPDIVYMQNHCGVYRRRRGEKGWTDISKGLPSRFGFPIAAHPRDAGTVYAVPLAGDFNRVVAGGAMAVYRTTDGGKRWSRLSKGLPQKGAYHTVLRAGMSTDANDPAGVYVGTTTGQLYASRDEGAMWTTIADGLPPILSVDAALAWPTRT
ncbi:MAG TPA: exo-alpha-sialidase [Burkholderiales bacterium]|nr:exo-alpha-sialidase [Burkholderiales bacterium]